MRIGLLSDTHLYGDDGPWDEIRSGFAGVDLIFHAGDICSFSVLDRLETIAPVKAALGNWDEEEGSERLRRVHFLSLEGWRISLMHDMEPEDRPIADLKRYYLSGQDVDIMVSGNTHYERIDHRDGVLQINPGSPNLPHNFSPRLGVVGLLDLRPGWMEARVVRLGETPGKRNPGQELVFRTDDPVVRRVERSEPVIR